jgi:hypothetical protein
MQNELGSQTPSQQHYQSRIQSLESQIQSRHLFMQRLVWVRLGLALPGFGLIAFGMLEKTASNWIRQLGIVLVFGFLVAATIHENNLWASSLLMQRLSGYRRLLYRCQRDWSKLPPLVTEEVSTTYVSDLARDLDLFGERSLYRWLSITMTHAGATMLCDWLSNWTDPTAIAKRQEAVRELAQDRTWRLAFFETACNYQRQTSGPEGIVDWARSPHHFLGRRWLQILTWLSPIVLIFGIVCILASKLADHEIGQTIGLVCMLSGAAINFFLTMSIIGPIHDTFVKIGAANRELQSLLDMIGHINTLAPKSELLQVIREKCIDQQHSAETAMRRLQRWMALAGMQRSPLMFILYLGLQISVLWDVRVLELLEGWKRVYGSKTAGWLEAIGMMEALCSAASVCDDNPRWAFPSLIDDPATLDRKTSMLSVKEMAHPLLRESVRVPNSVDIQPSNPLLLVTGSNMAGKSTLLRSIGVNAILARIGSPVCAEYWSSASLDLASSIRVQDSLQDGVSFFMAELKRLRTVVDIANEHHRSGERQMLVLLDEILQGTNSRERQIAVEHVLDKLVEYGCIVITSTHDLEMAGNPKIRDIAQIVHFREHFESQNGSQVMRFDYVMRSGVTPTTNALKLLEMVGLRVPEFPKESPVCE